MSDRTTVKIIIPTIFKEEFGIENFAKWALEFVESI